MPDIDMTAQEAEIARLEAELAETEDAPVIEEQTKDEVIQEELTKEEVVEEPKVEENDVEPAKDDHAAWARLRRERAEEKRKADALAQELAELRALVKQPQPEPKKETTQAPDPQTDPEGYLAWKITENDKVIADLRAKVDARENQDKQTYAYQAAVQEFSNIVNDFKTKQPDFGNASEFLEAEMRKAIRLQNPTIPASQVQQAVNAQVLKIASEFARQGLNPAEEFYSMAHEFGYKKPVAQPVVPNNTPQKPKTNLNQIDKVKQRAVSGLNASGASSSAGIGLDALEGMSVQDFARLTPEQLRELESQ